uniref:Uncharacterized protein n=1 Tax=Oryza glumipatula TaxID=40148 RepID=A0A0D9ZIJ1_9ORYZ
MQGRGRTATVAGRCCSPGVGTRERHRHRRPFLEETAEGLKRMATWARAGGVNLSRCHRSSAGGGRLSSTRTYKTETAMAITR